MLGGGDAIDSVLKNSENYPTANRSPNYRQKVPS